MARINATGRPQGGLQAIVRGLALVCLRGEKHVTGASFLFSSRVLIGSQRV